MMSFGFADELHRFQIQLEDEQKRFKQRHDLP
jgi:hypothetical protein